MLSGWIFWPLYAIVRAAMFLWHPVFHVRGRENLPAEGSYVICPNHSGLADPVWVVLAMKAGFIPRIMAKKELFSVPLLRNLVTWLGAFGVDRDGADVGAIKLALRCLKDGQPLMIFPEGTRMKPGKQVEPKAGALVLAARAQCPIVPAYLTARRRPFSPMTCVFGQPYTLEKRLSEQEQAQELQRLMKTIYEMGEKA